MAKKIIVLILIVLIAVVALTIFLKKEDSSMVSEGVEYYQLDDGTWTTGDGEYTYDYKVEITGRMNNAVKDSTYIILSNKKNITFEQAWKASGLSSNLDDYFQPEEAVIVEVK